MKNFLLIAAILMMVGCGGASSDQDSSDQTENQVKPNDTLDALLGIADEKQLKEMYGEANVRQDTIYGAEGEISMGTVLYPDSPDMVVVQWEDEANRKKVIAVNHSCQYDMQADKLDLTTRWVTRCGVKMGTPLTELVKLNGKDFSFYGLGWDYGGGVINWNEGKLAPYNLFVTLSVEEVPEAKQSDYEKIMGEDEYTSADPAAKSVNPQVFEIVLSKE